MNIWTERSIELARNTDYLDQLMSIYPIPHEMNRPINHQMKTRITQAFESRNLEDLIRILIEQEKFPILDPYIGSLREDESAVNRNPQTIQRISRILYTIGLERIIAGIEEPPQANRQLGQMFSNWLITLQIPFLDSEEFLESNELCLLLGSDTVLKNFANQELGCNLQKKPDFVCKKEVYLVGEAKFISSHGGNQDKSFREVLNFVAVQHGNAHRVGVLDGVVWFSTSGLYSTVRNVDYPLMSALLFNEYLRSL